MTSNAYNICHIFVFKLNLWVWFNFAPLLPHLPNLPPHTPVLIPICFLTQSLFLPNHSLVLHASSPFSVISIFFFFLLYSIFLYIYSCINFNLFLLTGFGLIFFFPFTNNSSGRSGFSHSKEMKYLIEYIDYLRN